MKRYITGREAALGWAALAGLIVAYEVVAPEGQLLSEEMDRALIRWPVASRVVVAIVALHLLNMIPDHVDPLHRVATLRRVRVRPIGAERPGEWTTAPVRGIGASAHG